MIISEDMTPDKHINKIVGETYNLLRTIKVTFDYLDEEMMKKILITLIRPRLEYAATIWTPSTKKNIRKIERIQRAATKMVHSLSELTYDERLLKLELPTLQQRRERGDLIATYRIMKGKETLDRDDLMKWDGRDTRGHNRKLKKASYSKDVKKNSFPHRVINIWNDLEEATVCAATMHEFKTKLDNERYKDGVRA